MYTSACGKHHVTNTMLQNGSIPPQSVEAILYLLQGVASHLHQHSSPHLQSVISLFPRMPLHPTLVKTALALLGKHLWIQAHSAI